MVKVYKEYFKKPLPKMGIRQAGWYYRIWYRVSGKIYSKEYPDRCKYTENPFLKRLYVIQDSFYFFNPLNYQQFDQQINQIIDCCLVLANEQLQKSENYTQNSSIKFLLERRAYFLEKFCTELSSYKKTGNVWRDIKKIKKIELVMK